MNSSGPETSSLHNLICANSQHHSEAVALLAPNCRPLTYGELLNQVEYVGNALRTLGIERSDRVAVVLPNGPDMAAAFLGGTGHAPCRTHHTWSRGSRSWKQILTSVTRPLPNATRRSHG